MKMNIKEALEIVLDLAEGNALEPEYQEEGELRKEALRQWRAINLVRKAFSSITT